MRPAGTLAFPTTRHMLGLVCYAAGLCALIAPLARRHNPVDAWLLATALGLAGPRLLTGLVSGFEPPGSRRRRHLLLCRALGQLSVGLALAATAAAVWGQPWGDLPFFARVEGRHWLLWWLAVPLWSLSACRAAMAWSRRRVAPARYARRLRQAAVATLAVVCAAVYHELAPRLMDGELVDLTRGCLSVGLLWGAWRQLPGRCQSCSRWALVRLPARPPFAAGSGERSCLACGAGGQIDRHPSPLVAA